MNRPSPKHKFVSRRVTMPGHNNNNYTSQCSCGWFKTHTTLCDDAHEMISYLSTKEIAEGYWKNHHMAIVKQLEEVVAKLGIKPVPVG